MYKISVSGVKVRVQSLFLNGDMLSRLSLFDELTPDTLKDLFIDFDDIFKGYENITEGYDVRYPLKISIENIYGDIDSKIICSFEGNDVLGEEIYYNNDKKPYLIYEEVIKNSISEYIINTDDDVKLSYLTHTIDSVNTEDHEWFCRNNIYYKGNLLELSFAKDSPNREYQIFLKK